MQSFQQGMERNKELAGLLSILPPVEYCCTYGSSLHPNNLDETRMIDYILGVRDPVEWHSENLKMNSNHYASWIRYLGGAKLVTEIADEIGVGVHFNPFVSWNNKTFKYGVVRMHDLIRDILQWERFYLSGRLQKPVEVLVDTLDVEHINSYNLKAATSAALLLLTSNFTEEDLYTKICSLSYMGDLRMLFAEDKYKVKKIVDAQFHLFRTTYKPILEEFSANGLLGLSSSGGHIKISQVLLNSLIQGKDGNRRSISLISQISGTVLFGSLIFSDVPMELALFVARYMLGLIYSRKRWK